MRGTKLEENTLRLLGPHEGSSENKGLRSLGVSAKEPQLCETSKWDDNLDAPPCLLPWALNMHENSHGAISARSQQQEHRV